MTKSNVIQKIYNRHNSLKQLSFSRAGFSSGNQVITRLHTAEHYSDPEVPYSFPEQ